MNPAFDPVSLSYQNSVPDHINQQQALTKSPCFTIQGNIGCGKSTFLEVLREKFPQAVWIEEPVKDWQDLGGKGINMLERYYKQPTRWGFTFQIYAIFTRIKKMQEACLRHPNKLKISQRSILADKYVFAEIMKQLGYMQYCEYEVYKNLIENFEKTTNIHETKIIYLRCSPQKCFERTKARMRPQESQIPLDYLKLIHGKHQKWFEQYDKSKVLIIDTDENFKGDEKRINEIMEHLKQFIYPEDKNNADGKILSFGNEEKSINKVEL